MSYATIDEAQDYFDTRLNVDPWERATTLDKTKALAMATRALDNIAYVGVKYDEEQEHEFPRDYNIPEGEVPTEVKYCLFEMALAFLDGFDVDHEIDGLWAVSEGYGAVRTTYDRENAPEHIKAGMTATAWRYIQAHVRDPRSIVLHRV